MRNVTHLYWLHSEPFASPNSLQGNGISQSRPRNFGLVVSGLVWLVGQVAGLLTSGAWPEVPLTELPGILARLRDHAGDPAAAWPANVRGRLPGPVDMYATLAGILTTPVALGLLAWWLHQPPAAPRPPATPARPGRRVLPPAERPGVPCCRRPSVT